MGPVQNLLVLLLLLVHPVLGTAMASFQTDSRDASYDASQGASHEPSQDASHEPSQGASHEPSQGASHEPSQGASHGASQGASPEANQDSSQDASHTARNDASQDPCKPCRCSFSEEKIIADCSYQKLDKVPLHLLPNITVLNLSGNNIDHLENGSLSYPNLTRLDVSSNGLRVIELDAFQQLRNLEILYLKYNYLFPEIYRDGLLTNQAKLKKLFITNNYKSRPYDASLDLTLERQHLKDVFKDRSNSSYMLKDIHTGNIFGSDTYPGCAFEDLVSLQELHIDGPKELYFGRKCKSLKQLWSLSLGGKFRTCYTRYLRNDTFENVPHLQNLDVSYCLLVDIELASFEVLKNLIHLQMSHNRYLGIRKMGQAMYGLQNSSLRVLNVNRICRIMGLSTMLSAKDTQYLKNMKLEELYIEGNRIEIIDRSIMINLPTSLRRISIRDNHLSFGLYMMELSMLTYLEWLDASYQGASYVSFFDTANLHSRNLLQLYGYNKPSRHNVTIYVPPNVTFVDVSHSKMAYEVVRFEIGENKLREVDISFNYFTRWTGPIIGLTHLEKLDASNNFCEYLAEGVFTYFPSLKHFDLSSNFLGYTLTNDTFGEMPLLEYLDLSNNKISSLPKLIFKNTNLLKTIRIDSNYLMSWNTEINNFRMTVINLSRNTFDEVPLLLRYQVSCMVSRDFQLYFKDNPLKCNCLTLTSLKWMRDHASKLHNLDDISCLDDSNRRLFLKDIHQIIFELDKKCSSYLGISIGVLCLVMLVLCLCITGIVYRFRWKLRYLYYLIQMKHRGYLAAGEEEEGGTQFEFDAFISYADEDRGFVVEDMRQILEGQHGIRLCIHHRDFLVGEAIAANILNAVKSSRRTVIVLSRNFLRSYWCKYEVEMAKMESIYTGRNTLLVVVLENIPVRDLPPDIVELMRQDSYVEYTDDREGQEVFWQNLERAVRIV